MRAGILGVGGGESGGDGKTTYATCPGGTQTSGYAFGLGQSAVDAIQASCGAEGSPGAGGGWYGGYARQTTGDYTNALAGGGSGHINTDKVTNGVMETGVNEGNGKVVITKLGGNIRIEGCGGTFSYGGEGNAEQNATYRYFGGYKYAHYVSYGYDSTMGDPNLNGSLPTRAGYAFKGFYTAEDGGVQVADSKGIIVNDGTYTHDDAWWLTQDLTLYAHWEAYVCTFTYHMNGGTLGNDGNVGKNTWTVDDLRNLLCNGSFNHVVNVGDTASVHGQSTPQSTQVSYGQYVDLCDYDNQSNLYIVRTGYHTRDGAEWCLTTDGLGSTFNHQQFYPVSDFADISSSDAHVDLYVNWVSNVYTVAYNANSGAGTMSDQSFTYDVMQALFANAFTRTGYTFAYWNTAADGSGTSYTDGAEASNLTATDGAIVTLYAQWRSVPYTVYFDPNGGTGTMDSQSFVYDAAQTLTANAFTRTHFTFKGWNTEPDGSGTSYADGEEVSNLATERGAVVTLYAQWEPDKYVPVTGSNGIAMVEASGMSLVLASLAGTLRRVRRRI